MVDDNFKQKGIMSEAVIAIIKFGLSSLQLKGIEAFVGSDNVPSLRIMEKNNFKKEGLLRKHCYVAGVYEDSIVFSILVDEYVGKKNEL